MCLQETHFAHNNVPSFTHKRLPHIYFTNATQKKRGVLITIKGTASFKPLEVSLDDQGKFIILLCKIDKAIYTIVNVYAPNTRQMLFIHKLLRKIQKKNKGNVLLCGDFSVVLDGSLDTTGPTPNAQGLPH